MKRRKIIVVEDSTSYRNRIKLLLDEFDKLELVAVESEAGKAINNIRKHAPDYVLLDLELSNSSGFEVLEAFAQDKHSPEFIVLTNHAVDIYRHHCSEMGVKICLDKTRDITRLFALLSDYNQGLNC